jgi:hypothetical protein
VRLLAIIVVIIALIAIGVIWILSLTVLPSSRAGLAYFVPAIFSALAASLTATAWLFPQEPAEKRSNLKKRKKV